jgi:hypothetical protein
MGPTGPRSDEPHAKARFNRMGGLPGTSIAEAGLWKTAPCTHNAGPSTAVDLESTRLRFPHS